MEQDITPQTQQAKQAAEGCRMLCETLCWACLPSLRLSVYNLAALCILLPRCKNIHHVGKDSEFFMLATWVRQLRIRFYVHLILVGCFIFIFALFWRRLQQHHSTPLHSRPLCFSIRKESTLSQYSLFAINLKIGCENPSNPNTSLVARESCLIR